MPHWVLKLVATVGYLLLALAMLGALTGPPSLLRPQGSFLMAFLAAGFQPIWKSGFIMKARVLAATVGILVAVFMTVGVRFLVMLALPALSKDLAANIIGISAGGSYLIAFLVTKMMLERLNRP